MERGSHDKDGVRMCARRRADRIRTTDDVAGWADVAPAQSVAPEGRVADSSG